MKKSQEEIFLFQLKRDFDKMDEIDRLKALFKKQRKANVTMNQLKMQESQERIAQIKSEVLLNYQTTMPAIYLKYSGYYTTNEIRLYALQALTEHILSKSLSCVKRKKYRRAKAKIEESLLKRKLAEEQGVDLGIPELKNF